MFVICYLFFLPLISPHGLHTIWIFKSRQQQQYVNWWYIFTVVFPTCVSQLYMKCWWLSLCENERREFVFRNDATINNMLSRQTLYLSIWRMQIAQHNLTRSLTFHLRQVQTKTHFHEQHVILSDSIFLSIFFCI